MYLPKAPNQSLNNLSNFKIYVMKAYYTLIELIIDTLMVML